MGGTNNLKNEINTIVIGKSNNVDSSGNNTDDNGNIIFGENNTYKSKTDIGENNFILGAENYLIDSEYSIITGNSNDVSGKNNLVVGISNKIGHGSDITTTTTTNISNNSYVLGNNNIIKVDGKTVSNTYIYGANNSYDATDSSFTNDFDSTTMIFGDRAKINWASDVSNQRFVFSTQEKFVANGSGSNNGHVFTIDKLGNTVIEGDLTVKGNKSITDLCGNDAAFNNLRVLNDLSGNDASFNNVQIYEKLTCGGDAHFLSQVDFSDNIVLLNSGKTFQVKNSSGTQMFSVSTDTGNTDISGTLKVDKIRNNIDSSIEIDNKKNGGSISFKTAPPSDGSPSESRFSIDYSGIKLYGGYASNGVTIKNSAFNMTSGIDMNGTLKVDGTVDSENLKVNTIKNSNNTDPLTISHTEDNKDITFKTTSDTPTEAMRLVANGKELKIYGGYADSNGVTIDSDGNLKMKGKLTVDGDIDPTGLILTSVSDIPSYSGKLHYFIKMVIYNLQKMEELQHQHSQ